MATKTPSAAISDSSPVLTSAHPHPAHTLVAEHILTTESHRKVIFSLVKRTILHDLRGA